MICHCLTDAEWTDGPCIYGGCPLAAEAAAAHAEYRADQARDRGMIEQWEREQGDVL